MGDLDGPGPVALGPGVTSSHLSLPLAAADRRNHRLIALISYRSSAGPLSAARNRYHMPTGPVRTFVESRYMIPDVVPAIPHVASQLMHQRIMMAGTSHPESAVDADIQVMLERRLGRLHARQRLGIEREFEGRIFGRGTKPFHFENWYSAATLIRVILKASGF